MTNYVPLHDLIEKLRYRYGSCAFQKSKKPAAAKFGQPITSSIYDANFVLVLVSILDWA